MALAISSRQLIYRLPPSGSSSQSRIENWPVFMLVCSDSLFDNTNLAEDKALLASLDPVKSDSAKVPSRNCFRTFGSSMVRSEEHTSELQSLMRISYAVFCLKKKTPEIHNA